jgi:hypothetical protein
MPRCKLSRKKTPRSAAMRSGVVKVDTDMNGSPIEREKSAKRQSTSEFAMWGMER